MTIALAVCGMLDEYLPCRRNIWKLHHVQLVWSVVQPWDIKPLWGKS